MKHLRTITAIAACALLSPLTVSAASAASDRGVEAQIGGIRAQYAAINRVCRRATRAEQELPGYSLEGGVLVTYRASGAVSKIEATYYGETGYAVEEYYFDRGRLIFVLRTEN